MAVSGSSRGFSWMRGALDPLVCLFALILWAAAVVVMAVFIPEPPDDAWIWLMSVGGGVLALAIGADRFSWKTVAIGVLTLVVAGVASLASLGLAENGAERIEGFRRAATAANAELTELENRPPPSQSLEDATKALERAREAVAAPATGFDSAARTLANRALAATDAALAAGNQQGASTGEATQAIEELAALLADEPAPAATAALAALEAALVATQSALSLDQADRQLADVAEARTRLNALCHEAGAEFVESGVPDVAAVCRPPRADDGSEAADDDEVEGEEAAEEEADDDEAEGERLLAVRRAQAELAVAEASVAFAVDDDAKTAAVTRVTERSQALNDALALLEQPLPSVSVADAVGLGASAVVSDVVGESTDAPLALELLGWVLVGVTALWFIRSLSIRNANRELGPVRLTPPKEARAEAEQFRTYLLRNLPEPGAVPGADAINEVSNLVVALEPTMKVPMLSALVAAVKSAVVVERGYNVEYCDLPSKGAESTSGGSASTGSVADPVAGSGPVELVVRVRHARTTELLAQRVVPRPKRPEALRAGAYWAAAVIINASKVVPQWARWDPESAAALATFHQEEDLGKLALDDLKAAARLAPTSGVLGLRLAHAQAVADNPIEAFAQLLQTVRQHPRYLVARYRLAVSASLLAEEALALAKACRTSSDLWLRLAGDLERVGHGRALKKTLEAARETPDQNADEVAKQLCSFGMDQLDNARGSLRTWAVLWNSLRTGDREEQRNFLPFRRRRRDVKQVGESCRYAVQERRRRYGGSEDPASLLRNALRHEAWVMERDPIWQVAYNLACFHSLASQREPGEGARKDHAFRLLELARRSRGSQQMKLEWLLADDDLKPLRGDPRWKVFLDRIAPTEAGTP